MENRSHALMAGAFTLLLLAAVIAIGVAINRDRKALIDYEIVSSTPVSGLTAQSTVRYQGVPVGKVLSLGLNPQVPGQVRIRIGVAPNTPITQSTWAELGVQGVTGASNIDLRDDGSSHVLLRRDGQQRPEIPLRPGLLERLTQSGGSIMNNLEVMSRQLDKVLSDTNITSLENALRNAASVSETLRALADSLQPVSGKVGPLVDALNDASRQAGKAASEIGALAQSARASLGRLEVAGGPMDMATRSLHDIAVAASRMSNETLPAVTTMANQVTAAARGISTTVQQVGEAPNSLIFGAPAPRPGPGEAGFAGFGPGTAVRQ